MILFSLSLHVHTNIYTHKKQKYETRTLSRQHRNSCGLFGTPLAWTDSYITVHAVLYVRHYNNSWAQNISLFVLLNKYHKLLYRKYIYNILISLGKIYIYIYILRYIVHIHTRHDNVMTGLRMTGPLCGVSTDHRWIPPTSNADLW